MNWERQAEQSCGLYAVSDFEQAGYRLVAEQVIYGTDQRSKKIYELLARNLETYRKLLGAIGLEVLHNEYHSYVTAIPRVAVATKMRQGHARLALVLRKFYDERAQSASLENGEAIVSLEEIEVVYREQLKVALPGVVELRELVADLRRYGIARLCDADDGQPFAIAVRPAIVDVLGEAALHRLASYAAAAAGDADGLDQEEEPDETA